MGLALIPAFATLIPRLRMPEGKKYTESQELNTPASARSSVHHENTLHHHLAGKDQAVRLGPGSKITTLPTTPAADIVSIMDLQDLTGAKTRKAKPDSFSIYFLEWRHLKTLLGTASCWFLLDIAFNGRNLHQSVLLADIGFSTGKSHWNVSMRNAIGNLIIAVSGYVAGYFSPLP
jgi:PHS family inorganic phosphate transporter-like MFS transporter